MVAQRILFGNYFTIIINNQAIKQLLTYTISIQFLRSKYNYDKGMALLFATRQPAWHISA